MSTVLLSLLFSAAIFKETFIPRYAKKHLTDVSDILLSSSASGTFHDSLNGLSVNGCTADLRVSISIYGDEKKVFGSLNKTRQNKHNKTKQKS